MSAKRTSSSSKTDWARVDALTDDQIDASDLPLLGDDFFARAELRLPQPKPSITLRLDAEVLTWFKSQGRGYQTRMNAVLRGYMDAQRKPSHS
jgi:uncharacterized protein (DUF4415 family)